MILIGRLVLGIVSITKIIKPLRVIHRGSQTVQSAKVLGVHA